MMISIEDMMLETHIKEEEMGDEVAATSSQSKGTNWKKSASELKLNKTKSGSRWNRSFGRNTWILDSGATSHMRFSLDGMMDLVPWKSEITVGNKEVMYSEQKGTFKGAVVNEEGIEFYVTMEDVLYVPGIFMNLFSLTKALQNPKVGIKRVGRCIALSISDK
jgi:hypothetical protein